MTPSRALSRVREADCAAFGWVAHSRTPWLDRALPVLSRAANHSKLWMACAAVIALSGRRQGQRAAVRGLGSVAFTSALVNLGIKRRVCRPRPSLRNVPAIRRLPVQPLTTSFPSGHAASAAAFATGVAVELPAVGAGLAPVAAAVAFSRVYVGVHYPVDVLVGSAIGAGAAALSRLQWPAIPRRVQRMPPARRPHPVPPNPDGRGVVVVVNRQSGSRLEPRDPVAGLRDSLPSAELVEVERADGLREALEDAASRADVVGVHGGDGSATMGAEAASAHGRPLLLLPGGTLNHLARDLRLESPEQALAALARGEAVEVDVAAVDGRPFLNTAGFGAYTAMLDARKDLERRLGRWPAHLVAVAKALVGARPLTLTINGDRRRVWMGLIGNCRHEPAGFAPTWRRHLDDGLLDVRLVLGDKPLARLRLVLSLLTGRLARSAAYEQFDAREVRVQSTQDGLRLARDGEIFDGSGEFTVTKLPQRLVVYTPNL